METQETATSERRFTYDGIIPKLGPKREGDMYPSLLPLVGGQPGLEYLQSPVNRARDWEDAGWLRVQDTFDYTIVGPAGRVHCALLVRGQIIKGIDSNASRRPLSLDKEIGRITGLDIRTGTVNAPADPVALADPGKPTDDEIAAAHALLARIGVGDETTVSGRDPDNGAPVAAEPEPTATKKALDGFKKSEEKDA